MFNVSLVLYMLKKTFDQLCLVNANLLAYYVLKIGNNWQGRVFRKMWKIFFSGLPAEILFRYPVCRKQVYIFLWHHCCPFTVIATAIAFIVNPMMRHETRAWCGMKQKEVLVILKNWYQRISRKFSKFGFQKVTRQVGWPNTHILEILLAHRHTLVAQSHQTNVRLHQCTIVIWMIINWTIKWE